MIGFGIDLAGYTSGKTSLAFVEIKGRSINAILLRDSALSKRRKTSASLREVLKAEAAVVRRCLALGPVAVDIPIDLQGLPAPANAEYIWQLTRRPIDRAVSALAPLGDRIGAPVARFAAIMREGDFYAKLGKKLFEAYPAGTLRTLNIEAGRYKGARGAEALISLCKALRIKSRDKNDVEIDAIICAIAAATPAEGVFDRAALKVEGPMPKGFRIPKSLDFSKIVVKEKHFETWMQEREASA